MDDEKRDNQVIDIESVLSENEVERTGHAGQKALQSTVISSPAAPQKPAGSSTNHGVKKESSSRKYKKSACLIFSCSMFSKPAAANY